MECLGGCPYALGASGNIVTEDLVFLLETMGLRTGVDIDELIAARAIITQGVPGEDLYGHIAAPGLPKGSATPPWPPERRRQSANRAGRFTAKQARGRHRHRGR